MSTTSDLSQRSFEEALKELESIVQSLEKGDVMLDQAVSSYERGVALKQHCEKKLKDAEERVEKITLGQNGAPIGKEPLDIG